MDLVQYMRKIETTDPEKVKKLKEFSTSNKTIDKPPQSRYFYCICSPSIHQLMQASVLPIKLLSPLPNWQKPVIWMVKSKHRANNLATAPPNFFANKILISLRVRYMKFIKVISSHPNLIVVNFGIFWCHTRYPFVSAYYSSSVLSVDSFAHSPNKNRAWLFKAQSLTIQQPADLVRNKSLDITWVFWWTFFRLGK